MFRNKCESVLPHQTRKIKPTRRSVSGVYAFRSKTSIAFESTLERDFLIQQEFNLSVLNVIPQPVRMEFQTNGRFYPYTPDFLVSFCRNKQGAEIRKPMLVEVKPRLEIQKNWSKWRDKFRVAFHYAKERNWEFRIYDESRIRNQALINIRLLDRYKSHSYPIEDTELILNTVKNLGVVELNTILPEILNINAQAHVWYLLANRKLDCDINKSLSLDTKLWIPLYDK